MESTLRKAVHNHLKRQASNHNLFKILALAPILAAVPMTQVAAQEQRASALEEIIVTARRRDENLQDVPVTVNVVTSEMIEDMNIRRFEDLQDLVAGLELEDRPVGPLASMRGVRFDAFASGNNPSVEFYVNDALITSVGAMNSMFDIGMIEVLRGPQGTLRGRASPSGSIIMTTRRPDLDRFSADIDMTATNEGGENIRGGISIPIIQDKLGVRIAGFVEENRLNHARSFRTGERAKMENDGWRVSVRFEPLDSLAINAYYQEVNTDRWEFSTLESADIRDPSLPPSPENVRAKDRLSGQYRASTNFAEMDRSGIEIEWDAGPVQINYSGSHTNFTFTNKASGDTVGFFLDPYPETLRTRLGQGVVSEPEAKTHELRLAGNISDNLSYVVGGLYSKFSSPTAVDAFTPIFFGGTAPGNFALINVTPVQSLNDSKEQSLFANLTYRFSEATELSAGLRHIDYEDQLSTQIIGGNVLGAREEDEENVIYTVSLAHNFSDNLMGYITAGSSWRPGANENAGSSDTSRSPLEEKFSRVDGEDSDSIEFGLKSVSLDGRLRLNGTVFYQKFDNYADRGVGGNVRHVNTNAQGAVSVGAGPYLAAMDLTAYGFELDGAFQITDRWDISGTYSWAQGKQKGEAACNDYFPRDGKPDRTNPILTVEEILAATGGEDISSCSISARSYEGPTWSTSLRTEYNFPLLDQYNGYVRLQARIYGNSKGNVTNPNDNLSSYGIFDLYAGIRSPQEQWGRWELMVFVKNFMNTERTLDYGTNPLTTTMQVIPAGSLQLESPYRSVSLSPPREAGINLRYNF